MEDRTGREDAAAQGQTCDLLSAQAHCDGCLLNTCRFRGHQLAFRQHGLRCQIYMTGQDPFMLTRQVCPACAASLVPGRT